jgi:disulfide bond formation protein DsbB
MIRQSIAFFLRNLPAFLFVAALVIASVRRTPALASERFLTWILLLPIGVTGLWAGISHVFFPATAAAHIGWQVSPFQLEVGMADLAIGITAVLSFWKELAFKAAAVCAASVFLLGDAGGSCSTDGDCRQFCAGKRRLAVLYGHCLPDTGDRPGFRCNDER